MPKSDVLKKSVTANNYTDDAGRKDGPVMRFMVGDGQYGSGFMNGLPPYPPPYWSFQRDDLLRSTVYFESMWASAIYIATTKIGSLAWKVVGDVPLQVRRAQELLLQADSNNSWVSFISKHLRDFLLTDNGAFIEIIRASSAAGSKVLGLMQLDSRRCMRTGDPDIPIIYRDRKGGEHEMRSHQVIAMSDMPDPAEMWYGVGLCAASRAYRAIYKLAAIENFVAEKVSGRRPLALNFVNNVSQKQIEQVIKDAEMQAQSRGMSSYMGAVVVGMIDPGAPAGVATINLAGMPEGFDPDLERRKAYLAYANAIGLDPQDIDPELLGSKSLGTGAQSRVIDDKASGKGIIAYQKQMMHMISTWIMPERVMFYFSETDLRDQIQQANLEKARTDVQVARVQGGLITPAMATQLLVDAGDLPQQFVNTDLTPMTELTDTSRGDQSQPPMEDEQLEALQAELNKLNPPEQDDMGMGGEEQGTDPAAPGYNPALDPNAPEYDPTQDPNSPDYAPSPEGEVDTVNTEENPTGRPVSENPEMNLDEGTDPEEVSPSKKKLKEMAQWMTAMKMKQAVKEIKNIPVHKEYLHG